MEEDARALPQIVCPFFLGESPLSKTVGFGVHGASVLELGIFFGTVAVSIGRCKLFFVVSGLDFRALRHVPDRLRPVRIPRYETRSRFGFAHILLVSLVGLDIALALGMLLGIFLGVSEWSWRSSSAYGVHLQRSSWFYALTFGMQLFGADGCMMCMYVVPGSYGVGYHPGLTTHARAISGKAGKLLLPECHALGATAFLPTTRGLVSSHFCGLQEVPGTKPGCDLPVWKAQAFVANRSRRLSNLKVQDGSRFFFVCLGMRTRISGASLRASMATACCVLHFCWALHIPVCVSVRLSIGIGRVSALPQALIIEFGIWRDVPVFGRLRPSGNPLFHGLAGRSRQPKMLGRALGKAHDFVSLCPGPWELGTKGTLELKSWALMLRTAHVVIRGQPYLGRSFQRAGLWYSSSSCD